jgi:serine/threonine-protein kinase
MSTTTFIDATLTHAQGADFVRRRADSLMPHYWAILDQKRLSRTEHYRLIRLLGSGGQGLVYLSERRGIDNFTLPVALKIFSPEHYESETKYDEAMGYIAHVAAQVSQIQQDNLLDVHNWFDRRRIRVMEMEWIDGFDLRRLLTPRMLERASARLGKKWRYVNEVVVTAGPVQPRLKPGVAIAVVRDCLAALAALHRRRIVHGDLKPSNVMLKRTGNAKVVDIGSAFPVDAPPPQPVCTPAYAAPEVLERRMATPQSDLASLGYVLIEMLTGRPPFLGLADFHELLQAKRLVAQHLPTILPQEVVRNELLMNFCRRLIAPDPARRFSGAGEADLDAEGAAAIQRQLVKGDLASEYDNDIRQWLEAIDDLEFKDEKRNPNDEGMTQPN